AQRAHAATTDFGLHEFPKADHHENHGDEDVDAVLNDKPRGVDDKLGHARQFSTHVFEHLGERGDNEPEHDGHGGHGENDQHHGVHERSHDFPLGLARLANLPVQVQQHRAHLAGDFAGANNLDPVMLEDLGILGGGAVERAAGGHTIADFVEHIAQ